MPTFIDRRRAFLKELAATYGLDDVYVEKMLDVWTKQRMRQIEIEVIFAAEGGATPRELSEQFGYSNASQARTALSQATDKAGLPRFPITGRGA